jgi:hypothetical protein
MYQAALLLQPRDGDGRPSALAAAERQVQTCKAIFSTQRWQQGAPGRGAVPHERGPVVVGAQRARAAEHEQAGARAREPHIEPPLVGHKADAAARRRTHRAEQHHVLLAALARSREGVKPLRQTLKANLNRQMAADCTVSLTASTAAR